MHDTPEKNGVAEWLNYTLVKKMRAMLLESNLPKTLWDYAIIHANYIKNCTYTCSLPDKTPYDIVHGQKPNPHDTYEWGKDVFIKIKQDDKVAHHTTKVMWIGYSSQSDEHLIYWPSMHKVSVERNLTFDREEKVKLSPTLPSDEPRVPTVAQKTISMFPDLNIIAL